MHDALTKHGLDAVVFSQCEGTKRPAVAYAGPRGDCAWPPDGAMDPVVWNTRACGLGLLIYEDMLVLDFDRFRSRPPRRCGRVE